MTNPQQHSSAAIAHDWWQRLTTKDGAQSGYRRAALARMRRAATPTEVMLEPEALRLVARLPRSPERSAMLAGVLAFVRESDDRSVARAVGRAKLDDDQPPALLSEGRFRRLLQTQPDELMVAMRRLVRMTKGRVNVRDLSFAILYWGDKVKQCWIFDYYAVADILRSGEGAPVSPASTQLER